MSCCGLSSMTIRLKVPLAQEALEQAELVSVTLTDALRIRLGSAQGLQDDQGKKYASTIEALLDTPNVSLDRSAVEAGLALGNARRRLRRRRRLPSTVRRLGGETFRYLRSQGWHNCSPSSASPGLSCLSPRNRSSPLASRSAYLRHRHLRPLAGLDRRRAFLLAAIVVAIGDDRRSRRPAGWSGASRRRRSRSLRLPWMSFLASNTSMMLGARRGDRQHAGIEDTVTSLVSPTRMLNGCSASAWSMRAIAT